MQVLFGGDGGLIGSVPGNVPNLQHALEKPNTGHV
jgi:hypothetical protein